MTPSKGEDGNDNILGGAGNDSIEGGAGLNLLFGNEGNDTIRARNLARDIVDGGLGTDSAQVDTISPFVYNERVVRSIETILP